jgi:hypothetical protein
MVLARDHDLRVGERHRRRRAPRHAPLRRRPISSLLGMQPTRAQVVS